MLKKLIITIIIVFSYSYSPIYSQSLDGWFQDISPDANLMFNNNQMIFTEFGSPPQKYETEYDLENVNNVTFVDFLFSYEFKEATYLNKYFQQGQQRWLVLFVNGYLFAYDGNSLSPILDGFIGPNVYSIIDGVVYNSDTYLTEGNIHYTPENLGILELNRPWVEGISGSGIGSKISISSKNRGIKSLLFSNGYVSYEKPYLFTHNNRVKQIHITNSDNSIDMIVPINDSPQMQLISLEKESKELFITIEEIYIGDKWDDTCINFILPLNY